jgi:hypothetical protein
MKLSSVAGVRESRAETEAEQGKGLTPGGDWFLGEMVGPNGLEPSTSSVSILRSTM